MDNLVRFQGGRAEFEDGQTVTVRPFVVARKCVTVEDMRHFCSATGYRTTAECEAASRIYCRNDHLMVMPAAEQGNSTAFCVSAADAECYLAHNGGRLMTEAEWLIASIVVAGEFNVRKRHFPSHCDSYGNTIAERNPAQITYGLEEIVRSTDGSIWVTRSGPLVFRTSTWRRDVNVNRRVVLAQEHSIMTCFRVCQDA